MEKSNVKQTHNSSHSHRIAPRSDLNDESVYYCSRCKKWVLESEYDIDNYMCKKCSKEVDNSTFKIKERR
jgi:hypothetical protein